MKHPIARGVVVLPTSFLGGYQYHLHESLTYSQREVGIGFNVVRAKDATVDGAREVEPIRCSYRANTELNASTDARHALIGARGMHAALPCYHARGIVVGGSRLLHCSTRRPSTPVLYVDTLRCGPLTEYVFGLGGTSDSRHSMHRTQTYRMCLSSRTFERADGGL